MNAQDFCSLVGLPITVTKIRAVIFDPNRVVVKDADKTVLKSSIVSMSVIGWAFDLADNATEEGEQVQGLTIDLSNNLISQVCTVSRTKVK